MARRWADAYVLGKVGGGLALIGVSTALWFSGLVWFWGWVVGGGLFLWGLLSIGDKKSEYGDW